MQRQGGGDAGGDVFSCKDTREKIKKSAFEFRLAQLQEAQRRALEAVDERLKLLLKTIPDDVKKDKVRNFE